MALKGGSRSGIVSDPTAATPTNRSHFAAPSSCAILGRLNRGRVRSFLSLYPRHSTDMTCSKTASRRTSLSFSSSSSSRFCIHLSISVSVLQRRISWRNLSTRLASGALKRRSTSYSTVGTWAKADAVEPPRPVATIDGLRPQIAFLCPAQP